MKKLLALVALFSPSLALCQTWDVATDFSSALNPNGAWSYGAYTPSTFDVSSFHLLDRWDSHYAVTTFNGWTDAVNYSIFQNISNSDSAENGTNIASGLVGANGSGSVIRWTAPTTGVYDILAAGGSTGKGTVSLLEFDTAAGVTTFTAIDQAMNYGDITNVQSSTFDQTLHLKQGDTIDLVVQSSSTVPLSETITRSASSAPAPPAMFPMAAGIIGVFLVRRRRR